MKTRIGLLVLLVGLLVLFYGTLSAQAGQEWTPGGVPACVVGGQQIKPQIICNNDVYVVWEDWRDTLDLGIYSQRLSYGDGSFNWGLTGKSVANSGNQISPRIVASLANNIIMYADTTSQGIFAQRQDTNGNTLWPQPVRLSPVNQVISKHLLIPSDDGSAIASWPVEDVSDTVIWAQKVDTSGTVCWGSGIVACCSLSGEGLYGIAPDSQGGAYLTWKRADEHIWAQHVDNSGNLAWPPNGLLVSAATGEQWDPQIVSDNQGGCFISWVDPTATGDDIRAQHVDGSGSFLWDPDGAPICTSDGSHWMTRIDSDGEGGLVCSWWNPDSSVPQSFEVYSQRLDSNGTQLWDTAGLAIITLNNPIAHFVSISDGLGGAFIAWRVFDDVDSTHTLAIQYVNPQGELNWLSDGLIIWEDTIGIFDLAMSRGSNNEALISWFDWRNNWAGYGCDVYAQKVSREVGMEETAALPLRPATVAIAISPNPTTGPTTIQLHIPRGTPPLSLKIYDVGGRLVCQLPVEQTPGRYKLMWDGRDDVGANVSGGIYLCRLTAGDFTATKKIVVLR